MRFQKYPDTCGALVKEIDSIFYFTSFSIFFVIQRIVEYCLDGGVA